MSLYALPVSAKPGHIQRTAAGSKWVVIAEGSDPNNIQSTGVVERVPHNCPIDITITTDWWAPIAPLFDAIGAEYLADKLYHESGTVLDDVEGKGLNTIVLHCHANAVQLVALVAVIAILFLGIAAVIAAIKMESPEALLKEGAGIVKWLAIGGLGLGTLMLGREFLKTREA